MPSIIRTDPVIVTLTGATGSNTTDLPVNGLLRAVHIDYADIAAATTDVTIKCLDPDVTLLTVSNSNTDGWYYPRAQSTDTSGTPIAGDYSMFGLWGVVSVAVADSDAGTVTVTLVIERIQ